MVNEVDVREQHFPLPQLAATVVAVGLALVLVVYLQARSGAAGDEAG